MQIKEQELMAQHTSWRVGGPADYFVEASDRATLYMLLQYAVAYGLPVLLLGGGTNVLVRDSGFPGLVIHYTAREWSIAEDGDTALLTAQAGVPIGRLVWKLGAQGWANLEWAAGLPGSVGGAIYGNAGCYGGDIAGVLVQTRVLVVGRIEEWSNEHMAFGYRTSHLKERPYYSSSLGQRLSPVPTVILDGTFRLTRSANPDLLVERMKEVASLRKAKTPTGSSCGSVFKNPPDSPLSAGQLLDQAGLKGTRHGGAEISEKHANYIVNTGDATADDILFLINLMQERVMQEFGVALELEVQIVG